MTLQETPFKTQKLTNEDYVEFLSKSSKSRKYSAIRALQKYLSAPGIVNLGGYGVRVVSNNKQPQL